MFFHSFRLRVVHFFRREHSIIFLPPRWYKIPPRGNVPSKVSIFLNPCIHHRFHFPWPFVCIQSGYASERHFLPQLPRRWNRGTVFPFPPFSFASLFRPPFLPVLLSIHFSTGLRLIIGILCFLIFPPIRWFPSLSTVSLPNTPSTPPRALNSIRWNSYTSRMVSFISIGWMWFPYFSQLNEFYLCRVYTSRWIMLIININEEKSKKISKRFKLPLWAYFNEIWNLKEKKKRMHGKRCNLMDGKNLR